MARERIEKHINSDLTCEEAYPLILELYSLKQRPRKLIVYASKYGHGPWVNLLLSLGWSAHIQDDKSLWEAFRSGHRTVAEFLLNTGTDFRRHPEPPIIQAIKQNQIEILELLVSRRTQFREEDIDQAAYHGNLQTFKLLLNNSRYKDPDNLLRFLKEAISHDNREVIKYLNNWGVRISEQDRVGYYRGINLETFKLLMDLGYQSYHIMNLIEHSNDREIRDFLLDFGS